MSEILDALETAQDEFVRARHLHRRSEARLKSLFASMYLALRDGKGTSIEDARQGVFCDKRYIDAWEHVLQSQMDQERKAEALELCRLRFEEWRTDEATKRRL